MEVAEPFVLRAEYNQEILTLLKKTTLGTNGARYQHLNTAEIIADLDNPLFLSLERNKQVIGNCAFCQRGSNWYIRYFAFDSLFQSSGSQNVKQKKSKLREQVSRFFDELVADKNRLYAYVDPKNSRSKNMCLSFGLKPIARLNTFSFSRLNPKNKVELEVITEKKDLEELLNRFRDYEFFTDFQPKRSKIVCYRNKAGQIEAAARIQQANWKVERLPGKIGALLLNTVTKLPFIKQILSKEHFDFVVADLVYATTSENLEQLFETILAQEKQKLLLWWVDEKDAMTKYQAKINWGFFKYFLGKSHVEVVAKYTKQNEPSQQKAVFVSGVDLI